MIRTIRPPALVRLSATIACLLICFALLPHQGAAQGYNLIVNGSFESPVVTSCTGPVDRDYWPAIDDAFSWMSMVGTADLQWDGCSRRQGTFDPTPAGRQWGYMFTGKGDEDEGMTQRLQRPLQVGETYTLSFLAITRNPLAYDGGAWPFSLPGKGKINIYLSQQPFDTNTFSSQRRIWGDEDNGRLTGKAKRWNRYQSTFVADAPYEYIMIVAVDGVVGGPTSSAIDDLQLFENNVECDGNMVPNWSMETLAAGANPRDWKTLFGDYYNWDCVGPGSPCDYDPGIIDHAHTGRSYTIIRSKDNTMTQNNAIEAELRRPMVAGQRYRFSFYAATKAPLLVHKGEVRLMGHTEPMEWSYDLDGYMTGTELTPYIEILGSTTEWRQYSYDFVASDNFTRIAIQTGRGYHVAIDDICITDIPFRPGTIQFSRPEYAVQESMGPATITLERIGGMQGSVTATFETVRGGGSAAPGADYNTTITTVTFQDGEVSATVDIPLINDIEMESDETVALILRDPTGGATIGRGSATLTIHDDMGGLIIPPSYDPLAQGKMVWVSNRNAQGQITPASRLFTRGVRSSQKPKVVPNTDNASNPVWSSDGRFIAFNTTITRQVTQGDVIRYITDECVQVADETGRIYATYFPSTSLGVSHFGAPQWSGDGTKLICSYYNQLPQTGIAVIEFLGPYDFTHYTVRALISSGQGMAALAPVFSPNGSTVYFHGAQQAANYGNESRLFSTTIAGQPVQQLSGNGVLIDHAFHASVHPNGGSLLYSSDAYRFDSYGIFDEDEIMSLKLATGANTRITSQSENDWGSFATGALASGQFIRHVDIDGDMKRDLVLQQGTSLRLARIGDSLSPTIMRIYDDHTPSWVIPKMNIWDFDKNINVPNVTLTWKSIRIDPVEGQTFRVERSVDREIWGLIGEVTRGTVINLDQSYQFNDPFAFSLGVPVVYYRLALIDPESQDGYTYSYPLEVCLNCPQLPGESLE